MRMNKLFIFFIFNALFAQVYEPVKWRFEIEQSQTDRPVLVMHANIQKGWYIYSQMQQDEMGPLPMVFDFVPRSEYKRIGGVQEPQPIEKLEFLTDILLVAKVMFKIVFQQFLFLQQQAPALM